MKILRVSDVPDNRTGGMSRAIYSTGDYLIANSHQVDYLFSQHFQSKSSGLRRRLSTSLQIPRLVDRLAQQGKHYDVVEIHEPLAAAFCLLRKIGKSLPPVAIFSHGLEKRNQLAELAYNRQKGLPISLPLRYGRFTVLQSMYGLRHCDQIICLNSEDFAYLRQVGIPQQRLTQVNNGVDTEFLLAGEAIAQADSARSGVLFLGNWLARKGILDLVPAMICIMQKHPALKFTVAGCGEESSALNAFPDSLHSRIQIIPKVFNNQELIELYRQHSIFVLPSYFEGQPLVMLEAAAMGLAIVTTNICGMADFIENHLNGLTVPVGNSEALIQAIDSLILNYDLSRKLGEKARQKVQKYNWENAAKEILSAYKKAIK